MQRRASFRAITFFPALFLTLALPFLFSASSTDSLDAAYNAFPTLREQIALTGTLYGSAESTLFTREIDSLSKYLASAAISPDLTRGVNLILQPDFYKRERDLQARTVSVDGNGADWAGIWHTTADSIGDSPDKRSDMDVTQFTAFLCSDGMFSWLTKTAAKPARDQAFAVIIDALGDDAGDFQLITWWNEGTLRSMVYDLRTGGELKGIEINVAYGDCIEGSIDLNALLNAAIASETAVHAKPAIKTIIRTFVESYTADGKADYSDLLYIPLTLENIPLRLLLFLCGKGAWLPGDSMTCAIAMADSRPYVLGDSDTRKLVLADMASHFSLYREIVTWQKENDIPGSLDKAPVIPKIFWADRFRYYAADIAASMTVFKTDGVLTVPIYREFVDSIETLRGMRDIALKNGIFARTIANTAPSLEEFVHRTRVYRSSMENLIDFNSRKIFSDEDLKKARDEYDKGLYYRDYFGAKRRWDDFRWLNYQYKLYTTEGSFKGDCGDTTVVQMGFYKAIGIAPLSFQWINPELIPAFTHNFPGHYDTLLGRWYAYQKPVFYGPAGKELPPIDTFLHYSKPYWHPWFFSSDMRTEKIGAEYWYYDSYFPGEKTGSARMKNWLTLGFNDARFEELFLSEMTQKQGLFFTTVTAPDLIVDTDSDSLPDSVEKEYGCSPGKTDSDGDGYSDLWELENGYDPKSVASPGSQMYAIDGHFNPAVETNGAITLADPAKDNLLPSEYWDIKSFAAKNLGDSIYFAVSYYNDIRTNSKTNSHSFLITLKNKERRQYFIQWWGDYINVLYRNNAETENWTISAPGMLYEKWIGDIAEFRIPLSIFTGADIAYVMYYSGGYDSTKTTHSVAGDLSGTIRIALTEKGKRDDDSLLSAFDEAVYSPDPKGDARNIGNARDIFRAAPLLRGNDLAIRVSFYPGPPETTYGVSTIYLRGKNSGLNYWIQWIDRSYATLRVWKDGEDSHEVVVAKSLFDCVDTSDGYIFVLPAFLLKGEGVCYVKYLYGDNDTAGKFVSDIDTVGKMRVALDKRYDIESILNKIPAGTPWKIMQDPAGDCKPAKIVYDIREFAVARSGEYLYCRASFATDTTANPFCVHSIFVRNPLTKENRWIQWWDFGFFSWYSWHDGEQLVRQTADLPDFDCFIVNGTYWFVIPLPILGSLLGPGGATLDIQYYTDGLSADGVSVSQADSTLPLTINLTGEM